jgi:hypothetical protein
MKLSKFSIAEMYSNSKGKTSASLVAGHLLIATGCFMGIKGSFTVNSETMLQGIAYATLGAGLLGIRRFTSDKEISETAKQNP